jgi:hypothetical protein
VTGRACEAYETGCNETQGGTIQGGKLTYYYKFDIYRVAGPPPLARTSICLTAARRFAV